MESADVMISVMNAGYEQVNGAYKKEGPVWIRRTEDGTQFIIGMDQIRDGEQALCLWEVAAGGGDDAKTLRYVDHMEHGPIGGVADLHWEVADAQEPIPQVVLINTYYATEDDLKASEEAQMTAMSGGGGGGMLGDNLDGLADTKALRSNSATVWTNDQLDKLQEAMMDEMGRLGREELWRKMDQNDSLRMVPQATEKQQASDRIGWRLQPTQRPTPEELVNRGFLPAGYEPVVKGSKDAVEVEEKKRGEDESRDSIAAKAVAAIQSRKTKAELKERAETAMTWKFGQRADLRELIARGIVPPELADTVRGAQDYDQASSAVKQRHDEARESLAGKLDLHSHPSDEA